MLEQGSPNVKLSDVVTVMLTAEQYDIALRAFAEAKRRDMKVRDWTGETVEQIDARYQLPHDDILEDMLDYQSSVRSGIPAF